MLNEFLKKEAPIHGLAGMGGGVPSRLLTLASGEITYVDDVFSIDLWDGDGGSTRTITNGIDLAGEGGMVWGKTRSASVAHVIADTENGVSKNLFTNTSDALEDRGTGNGSVDQFNSNGFTIGDANDFINYSGHTACSWTFRKCPGFFDIVTYTGNGSAGHTVAHNLGSVPGCIFIKRTDISKNWIVYHRGLDSTAPEDYYILLNDASTRVDDSVAFNDTAPTDTEFTLGTYSHVNADGGTYVAYLFAHNDGSFGEDSDEAVIKCGSYTGSTSAVSVNLGFEPQYVLVKNTSTASNFTNWAIFDNMRGITGGADIILGANMPEPEGDTYLYSGSDLMNLSATGFVVDPPGSQSTVVNSNGSNFIYIAIRRPHKPPEDATDVFAIDTKTTKSANTPSYTTNFPVDFALRRNDITSVNSASIFTRLTATERLLTDSKAAASTAASFDNHFMFNNGYGDFTSGDSNDYGYFFKRAPGFMDVVTYTGNGVQGRNISHNLKVAPELMIVKNRDTTNDDWMVYASGITYQSIHGNDPDNYGNNPPTLKLQSTDAANFSMSGTWDHTHPTASVFRVGDTGSTNGNGEDLIALLFASLDGISKVGTYTGTANAINVDCGFTDGARFVLIKRVDSSTGGHWYVFDTSQGINSGSDPFFRLNVTNAQGTADLIDPLDAGFSVASGTTNVNYSGGTYLFLAIA